MTSDTCVLSVKQDGGSGDDRDFLLFWASINGMAPTTTNYEATNEEKAYALQKVPCFPMFCYEVKPQVYQQFTNCMFSLW